MRTFVFASAVLVAASVTAYAQEQQQRAPSAEEMSVFVNWNNMQAALSKLLNSYQMAVQENATLRKRLTDMDEYLKACKDKPGCTVPVPQE